MTIDKATGASTVVGPSGIGSFGGGLASNAAGVLYLAPQGDDGDLFTVDRSTGAATSVATWTGPPAMGSPRSPSTPPARCLGTDKISLTPTALLTINTGLGSGRRPGPSIDRLDAIVFAPKPGRSVNLQKKNLKKGTKVRLSGHVDSPASLRTLVPPALQVPGSQSACEVGQTVELQRKKPKAGSFGAFQQLTTDNAGNFSTEAKVKKTFQYRAVLSETPRLRQRDVQHPEGQGQEEEEEVTLRRVDDLTFGAARSSDWICARARPRPSKPPGCRSSALDEKRLSASHGKQRSRPGRYWTCLSFPAPPFSLSLPGPPFRVSLPASP